MGYRPNAIARNLRSSRTHTVGLIWENFAGLSEGPLYFAHLLDGIAQQVLRHHYRLTILPELAERDEVLRSLGDGQLEGVIWCKLARDEATLRLIHECPIPIVALNAPAPCQPTSAVFVSCDNEGGIELAIDHLFHQGHRRFLFIQQKEEANTPDCIARRAGFVSALRKRGQPLPEDDVVTWGWNLEGFDAWWESAPPHTAIVCWSERAAASFLHICRERNIGVPERFSVVGFDSTQFCDTTSPRLTAVRQPIFEMASFATKTLFDLIAGQSPEDHSAIFPCTLGVRDSTTLAPPQSGGLP
jgi:LacI family transcriptional regulator